MSESTSTSSPNPGSTSDSLLAFDGADEVLRAWGEGLAPDPELTVSEWADRHRVLSSRASAEPGRYRTDRTPAMRAVMDALSPSHPAERIVFMKAAQVGATEAGNNWIGYVIDQVPGPMLAVQPTVELAKRNSRQRIDPLIEESLRLRERVQPARARDAGNTVLSKEFRGGILILTGANSAVGLRSIPARYLFLDEIDAYPPSADQEGDPVALAEARSLTFAHRRKVFLVSTPTLKGLSRIEQAYERSDQRRYFVPCPHCGHRQWLRFERLRWEPERPETAHYLCEGCEAPIEERHKTTMFAAGEWRPTAEARDASTIGFPSVGAVFPGRVVFVGAAGARVLGGQRLPGVAPHLDQHRARRDLGRFGRARRRAGPHGPGRGLGRTRAGGGSRRYLRDRRPGRPS